MTGFFFRKSRKIESEIAVLEFFPYPEPYELKSPLIGRIFTFKFYTGF